MYAVLNFGGHQVKAVPGAKIFVNALNKEVGEVFDHTDVLLFADGETVTVGTPTVAGVAVKLEVLDNFKGKKVMVFKKKRRKGYRRKKGHRAELTALKVVEIRK